MSAVSTVLLGRWCPITVSPFGVDLEVCGCGLCLGSGGLGLGLERMALLKSLPVAATTRPRAATTRRAAGSR